MLLLWVCSLLQIQYFGGDMALDVLKFSNKTDLIELLLLFLVSDPLSEIHLVSPSAPERHIHSKILSNTGTQGRLAMH